MKRRDFNNAASVKVRNERLRSALLDNIVEEDGPLESKCWIWTGVTNGNGYGRYGNDRAHRVAYRCFVGEFPEDLQINHHCDVRLCINPEHLYAGTQKQNTADMFARRREAPRRGEQNGKARLTEQQAVEVLKLLNEGHSQASIGRRLGVNEWCVGFIARGTSWRHVPGPRPKRFYSSRYRGVSKRGDKWEAHIVVNRKQLWIASFGFESDAAIAYNTHVAYLGLDRPLNQITEFEHD